LLEDALTKSDMHRNLHAVLISVFLGLLCRAPVSGAESSRSASDTDALSGLQQLIRVNVDRDGDVFGEWQFVESFSDEAAQAHDGFAADQNVETELAL
jgi:hypothetical protein